MEFQSFLYIHSFLAILIAFILGVLSFPMLLKVAIKKDMVVRPNHRTAHKGLVPNIGGVIIFSSWFLTIIFFLSPSSRMLYILAGAYIIMIVGLIDDLIIISPKKKIIGQLLAGIFLIFLSQFSFSHLHGILGITVIPMWIGIPLTFFVYLYIVNSLNLIDGVDGLASGLGMISSLFFGIYFYLSGHFELAVMAFALVGALLIFFIYNVFGSRRKIFMGDSGSLVVGYLLALFVVQFCELNAYDKSVPVILHMSAAPVVAFCVLAVPLFDTLRVFLTRIKKGKSPFHPDKNHIHHLMLKLGFKHKEVSYILMGVNLIFVILGIIGRDWPIVVLSVVTLGLATFLTLILWHFLNKNMNQEIFNQDVSLLIKNKKEERTF